MTSSQLHDAYNEERNRLLDENEFFMLITLFPAALVATADHTFDEKEKEYLADVVANAALELYKSEPQAERFASILFDELLYLSKVSNKWQKDFLSVLARELSLEEKIELEKLLISTAEVSKGISSEESEEIERIMNQIRN